MTNKRINMQNLPNARPWPAPRRRLRLVIVAALLAAGACENDPEANDASGQDPGFSEAPSHPEYLPPPPATAPELEPPVQEVRGFGCTPEAVGPDGLVIGQLTDGSEILIREPAAVTTACTYHLLHRAPNGDETQLSSTPGGYLFALGWASGLGDVAVCASNIAHTVVEGRLRRIDTVAMECAFRVSGMWTELAAIVEPNDTWAAWPRGLSLIADGVLALDYLRDSTFNLLNMSDSGRPPEDGVYRRTFTLSPTGFSVSDVEKVSDRTNPFAGPGEWAPTPEQKAEFGDVIDFSDGDCPNGCSQPTQP